MNENLVVFIVLAVCATAIICTWIAKGGDDA